MLPVQVLGTGRAIPKKEIKINDLINEQSFSNAASLEFADVQTRYYCSDEDQVDLAVEASQNALNAAQKTVDDIDLIISGCGIPYQTIPSTAPLIMQRLGLSDGSATAFDVNSTCLSFVSALDVAARMIASGDSKCALIVASERASRALPWRRDPHTASLFGDGAGAAILSPSESGSRSALKASLMRTFPSAYYASQIGAGGTRFDFHEDKSEFERHSYFEMNGRALFRTTAQHFSAFVDDLLDKSGWSRDDVDLVIPHQASPIALQHMVSHSGFDQDQVFNIVADYGNQIAASIPFALDLAIERSKAACGSKLMLIGTSAGVSIGGCTLEL